MPSPYANGYRLIDGPQHENCTFRYSVSTSGRAGSIVSTAGDVVNWLGAFMDGRLLSVTSHRAQWDTTDDGSGSDLSYGLGVARSGSSLGYNGNYNHVYTSTMFRYLVYDIVILANGQTQYYSGNSSATNIYYALRACLDQYINKTGLINFRPAQPAGGPGQPLR